MPAKAKPWETVVVNSGVRYKSSRKDGIIQNSYDIVCNAFIDGREVGVCEAKLFTRDVFDKTVLNFWGRMSGLRVEGSRDASSTKPMNESERLAFDLFDHYGRFRKKFYRHPVACGTMVWDSDLELGQIVLVEKFHVDPQRPGLNISTQMFQRLLEMAINGEPDLQEESSKTKSMVGNSVFTRAGILHRPNTKQRHIRQNTFRSLGFRRVGNAEWFTYSSNPNHPSRHLRADRDLEIPSQETSALSDPQAILFTKVSSPSISDAESVGELKRSLHSPFTTEGYWLAATAEDGDTLLHRAAKDFKPKTVEELLRGRPGLATVTNGMGYTPYQALEEEMEKLRFPFTNCIIKNGKVLEKPFPCEADECLLLLKQHPDRGEGILQNSIDIWDLHSTERRRSYSEFCTIFNGK